MSRIVDFLEGKGPDASGREINQVLGFGLGMLESRHDFIQWLFPLPEPSRAVPGSPFLQPEDIEAIRASRQAQANLAAAQTRMDWFYTSTDHWLQPGDHNHLRITRIIKSLRLLVSDARADQFRAGLLAKANRTGVEFPESTLAHWRDA